MLDTRKKMGYIGLLALNFMSMFLIACMGVVGYAMAGEFDAVSQVGLVFALETCFRCTVCPISGKLGEKLGRKQLLIGSAHRLHRRLRRRSFRYKLHRHTRHPLPRGRGLGLLDGEQLPALLRPLRPERGPQVLRHRPDRRHRLNTHRRAGGRAPCSARSC